MPPGGRVIFTSGATEAINLAIMGTGLPVSAPATEHAAVLDCVHALHGQVLAVTEEGALQILPEKGRWHAAGVTEGAGDKPPHIAADPLHHALRGPPPHAGEELLAIMLVNNEIGTIQPIANLAAAAHACTALS